MSSIQTFQTSLFWLSAWLLSACASHHDLKANDEADDATDETVDGDGSDASAATDSGRDGGCDSSALENAPGPIAPFLGSWTMTATSRQQCSMLSLVGMVQTVVRFEQGAADGGADLLFDPGLGCWLPMAVDGNVAQLAPAPVLCGSVGAPPDLEFSSLQVTVTGSSGDITIHGASAIGDMPSPHWRRVTTQASTCSSVLVAARVRLMGHAGAQGNRWTKVLPERSMAWNAIGLRPRTSCAEHRVDLSFSPGGAARRR